MSGQERVSRPHDPAADDAPAPVAPQVRMQDSDVDALLDSIDDVLEQNAESFVRGFVQKGGE